MTNRLAGATIACWAIVYGWVAAVAHLSLRTNAYDLSLFDYAVWNTVHGRAGYVPFIGHSIFSEHFMPAIYVIAPVYALAQTPATLIALQLALAAAAAWLLHRLTIVAGLGPLAAFAIVFAFLLSRRSHEAVTSFFYPESAQPLLMFAVVLAWMAGRRSLYWVSLILLLMTKEDAAVYAAAFGALQLFASRRRRDAAVTIAVALIWLAVAMGVMIPRSRAADGLAGASHFLSSRYGGDGGDVAAAALVSRIARFDTLSRVFNLLSPFALVSLAAPAWLAVALPGLLVDRAAAPEAMQSALTGHYAFPLLPWIAVAAAFGIARIARAQPRLARAWSIAIVAVTVVDAPLFRPSTAWRIDPEAARVRAQLPGAARDVAAQPNLIPHLPHDNSIAALWPAGPQPSTAASLMLTPVGDLWPFTDAAQVRAQIDRHAADPRLTMRSSGPLYWFERRP